MADRQPEREEAELDNDHDTIQGNRPVLPTQPDPGAYGGPLQGTPHINAPCRPAIGPSAAFSITATRPVVALLEHWMDLT